MSILPPGGTHPDASLPWEAGILTPSEDLALATTPDTEPLLASSVRPALRPELGLAWMMTHEPPPYDWVFPGLPAGRVGMVAGTSGVGKTWLALQIAVGVATGSGWPWMEPTMPGRVLYLAGEERNEVLIDRMRVIAQSEPMSAEACNRLDEAMDLVSMVSLPDAVIADALGNQGARELIDSARPRFGW